MAKEIEEYFVKRLQSYLLEYLQDFSQNNMAKFSLGISSNIILKNLQIKKQALLNFSFPMYIIDGKINSITINMPLNYKSQQPEMIIEGIDLQVCTIQEANLFVSNKEQQSQQGVENLKKHKLKIWEEQMAKYFEQLSPPNWIQKIVDGIYNNMSVQVKSFFLRFYNFSIFGYETQLKIKVDINIKATDKQFQQKFNSDLNCIYKLIEIKKLGITYLKIPKKKEEQHLLNPIDIIVKLTMYKNQEELSQPIQSVEVTIDNPIIFQINKESKNYILKLNEVLQNLEIVQDNFHFRPKCEVKANYSEWWKYLINAVMQNQKNHKLDLGYSSRRLVLMKRYIELYKRKQTIILVPWLTSWTMQDETKFKKCEEQMSLKDLLKYREWAFQEIRIEAKRYYHSSKDGQNQQSVKPVLEIWTNTINNQNSFKDQKKRDDDIPIELEDDEKINLYEILERDKTQVLSSYLKGQNNDPDQVKTWISINIHSIFLIILENRPPNVAAYCPKNTKIFSSCQCRKCIQLIKRPQLDKKKNSQFSQSYSISEVIKQTQKINDEGSFHTAKEIDSFYEDMQDLNKDDSQSSLVSSQDQKNNNSLTKYNLESNRSNKLILIVSMIGIKIPISIYQNGRIKTNEKDGKAIIIGEIKMLSPGMMPKLMEEKIDLDDYTDKQSPLFESQKNKWDDSKSKKKQFESTKTLTRAKLSEFVNDIFEVSVTKDQQYFSSSEICFQTLCEFLVQNQMNNIKCFLIDYENDKHAFQDFAQDQYKSYDKYFIYNEKEEKDEKDEIDESMLLHVIKFQKNENRWALLKQAAMQNQDKQHQALGENEQYWQSCSNKHRYLQEVHNKLIDIIKKSLFASFIEEFGDKIFPLCIINLKDKLTYSTESTAHNLVISLYLEGQKSEYKISPNNEKKKKISTQQSIDEQSNQHITIHFQRFSLFLSTKSLISLLDFSKGLDSNLMNQRQFYVSQDHKLLECILKSKPLAQELYKPNQIKFLVQLKDKLKVRIVSDQISNQIKTELKFQIKSMSFSTVKIDDLFSHVDNKNEQILFLQHHKFYTALKLSIAQFKIAHKYYSPDYKAKMEELKSYEKEQHQEDKKTPLNNIKQPISKQNTNQPFEQFSKQVSKSIDARQFYKTAKQPSSSCMQQQQQNIQIPKKQRDSKFHIKGIKQTILKTSIIALQLQSNIENHALLTDQKLYIQIPYFNLRINDSFICFIEFFLIFKNSIEYVSLPQQKTRIGQDSLLKAELDTLFHDHKEQSSDCKHCILKYRKTIKLLNILFGSIDNMNNSASIASWFHILNYESLKFGKPFKEDVLHKKGQGLKITFQSTPKGTNHGYYKSIIAFPILLITRDIGYFKDNLMIHSSASKFKDNGAIVRSVQKLDSEGELQGNQFDKHNIGDNLFSKFRPSSKRDSGQSNIPERLRRETNYILVDPAYKVKDKHLFWSKLDDKFIFYCRSNEKEMFKSEISLQDLDDKQVDVILQSDENLIKQTDQSLYILLYYNKPIRSELIQSRDIQYRNDKNSKVKLFFSLQTIKAVFQNQYAACNILTTFKNINKIQSIIQKVHDNVYYFKRQDDQVQGPKLQETPIKLLDDMIVSASIQQIYLKSNESFFKLQMLKIMLNLELLNVISNPIKSSFHNKNSSLAILESHSKLKTNQTQIFLFDDFMIMKCHSIMFSFNQVSIVDMRLLHISKLSNALQFQVEDISISIINNHTKQRENLLTMPKKEKQSINKSNFQQENNRKVDKPVAITIALEFQNLNPKINMQIQQGQILLSQKRVQDLLIAINSFYLINIEESISLRQHLIKYIFLQELEILGLEQPQIVNLFLKDNRSNQSALNLFLDLKIEELQISLQEQESDFFELNLFQIQMKKRLNQELELQIKQIELKPQYFKGEYGHYPNLIQQNGQNEMKISLENNVIHIENIQFYMISRYLNELYAFKLQIERILEKNKQDLAERYQNDFELQLQLKQQENFELNKEQFNYQILIKNSQIIIPQSSSDKNLIKIIFDQADLKIRKGKIFSKIPDIFDQKTDILEQKKLLIDYEDKFSKTIDNKLELQDIFITEIKGNFLMVRVDYEISCQSNESSLIKGNLLNAESFYVEMHIPSFEQLLGLSGWKYQDNFKITPKKLKMKLDLGKLLKIQSYIDQNFSEKSPLFEFQISQLHKISFDLNILSMEASLTRYSQIEKDQAEKLNSIRLYNQYKRKQNNQQDKQSTKQNYPNN
ncbi:unnamed protein product [Paramecium pentaurelia]|uniref:Uncharacterized protein n=1 Tax=Paramecium pentaurelia TaxID=43138 RepID=A0A8S1W939_9CILI|nr:unnamed protein product [Paramecium pentaurelia]